MAVYIVDIDNTLLKTEESFCKECGRKIYGKSELIKESLLEANKLYDEGHTIILFTGRNWDVYELTKKQLREIGIKYHELVMGKPHGTIIDDMAYNSFSKYNEAYCGK